MLFAQFVVTLTLTVGSAWVVRCCAQAERGRAALVDEPISYRYQEVTEPGPMGHVKARCTDPAFFRDCACLVLATYASRLVVAAAQRHLTVSHHLLRPPTDPLARAKHVLVEPGPLSLIPVGPTPGSTADKGHHA
jgi:hypothetical protein